LKEFQKRKKGFEPSTLALARQYSPAELFPLFHTLFCHEKKFFLGLFNSEKESLVFFSFQFSEFLKNWKEKKQLEFKIQEVFQVF
jgi:hypothetical protein